MFYYPQVDLVTGLAIEEACYAQVCNVVTHPVSVCVVILRGGSIWVGRSVAEILQGSPAVWW